MPREYLFVDEWDVDAPPEAVFDALADARTYPEWWRPVYIDTQTDGPPELGRTSQQHFKGRLPTTCTRARPSRGTSGRRRSAPRWTATCVAAASGR